MKAGSSPSSSSKESSKQPEESEKQKKDKLNRKRFKNKPSDETESPTKEDNSHKKNTRMIVGKPLGKERPSEFSEPNKATPAIKENNKDRYTPREHGEVSYRLKADVEGGQVHIDGVIDRLLKTPKSSITVGDILGASKPVREAVRKAIVPKRLPFNHLEAIELDALPGVVVYEENPSQERITSYDRPQCKMFVSSEDITGLP
jgi:hypothetical protein